MNIIIAFDQQITSTTIKIYKLEQKYNYSDQKEFRKIDNSFKSVFLT